MATPNGLNPSFEEVTVGGIIITASAHLQKQARS